MDTEALQKFLPDGDVPGALALDGYAIAAGDPFAREHAWLSAHLGGDERLKSRLWHLELGLEASEAGRRIQALERSNQVRVIQALSLRLTALDSRVRELQVAHPQANANNSPEFRRLWIPRETLRAAVQTLLRRKLPLDAPAFDALLDWLSGPLEIDFAYYPLTEIMSAIESWCQRGEADESINPKLRRLWVFFYKQSHQDFKRLAGDLASFLGEAPPFPIYPGEAWSDEALTWLQAQPPARQAAWAALLRHCRDATGSRPSAAWRTQVNRLLGDGLPLNEVKTRALAWFPLVNHPRTDVEHSHEYWWRPDYLIEPHQNLLRGLIWMIGQFGADPESTRALATLAVSAYRKVPGIGPRAVRIGNACVYALGVMPGPDALGQLARLRIKVKFGTAQKEIAKALDAAAAREGLPAEELEELAVPDYGLTQVGRLVRAFGDGEFSAELTVTGTHTTELLWRNVKTGKTQRAVPATVKSAHAEELGEFKAAAKDLHLMLPAQAQRLDALFLQRRRWPLATWRERYLDHPLVGTLARRLIWKFHREDDAAAPVAVGLWLDGALRDRRGHPLALNENPTTVSLWHPLDAGGDTGEITAWRGWLEEHEVRQPFKQAHREVYLLTPAEERTGTYSNRFAAHLLKQHQFHALCAARGWRNKLRLMVDDTYPPAARTLAAWGLRAEYWIEGVGGEYGQDTTDSGAYRYLATDQVRFYAGGAPQMEAHAGGGGYGPAWRNRAAADAPLPLTDVPALVFSEIMRDVDLFVGVASVGNDPAWGDGGPGGRHRDYWTEYSFGDLSATAQTRRDALERLVPRLKIAARCSFTDRFLVVRGELRTYKIHLGSGNILMSPDDRYLCIVPGSAGAAADTDAGPKVFLPFEGDRTLSVILSKAFLLAADDRITDPTIIQQIRA